MKKLITTASFLLVMANYAMAQEKNTVKKEKEPCFVSEFDANGKEVKVPCDKASKSNLPKTTFVTVNAEQDPATGSKKYYMLEFDAAGKEIKTYGNLVEEFTPQGASLLLFKYKTSLGKEVVVPAKWDK